MKNLISHINFLIINHNCVIIPNFGGFIANKENAEFCDDIMAPPRIAFAFNQDLKYNDGILAEAYMNTSNISYDSACKEIDEDVRRLNAHLSDKKTVDFGRIGELHLNEEDNTIVFTPAKNIFSHPSTLGCNNLAILPLNKIAEIKAVTTKKRKSLELGKIACGIVAGIAAVLTFFVASTPIVEQSNIQKSGFIVNISHTPKAMQTPIAPDTTTLQIETNITDDIVDNIAPKQEQTNKTKISAASTTKNVAKKSYYIIVAGEVNKKAASARLKIIQADGFNDAKIIESAKRNRIYVANFESRTDAEIYLSKFRARYPKYYDAWVYQGYNR